MTIATFLADILENNSPPFIKFSNLETRLFCLNRNARFRTGEGDPEDANEAEQNYDIPDVSDKEISQMISKVGGAAFLQLWKGIAQIAQVS